MQPERVDLYNTDVYIKLVSQAKLTQAIDSFVFHYK